MNKDQMTVEILADGSLKISTDPVSSANHGAAEMMLREIFKSIGGEVTTKHKHGKSGMHSHSHSHEKHQHQ